MRSFTGLWKSLWESIASSALMEGNKGTYNEMTHTAAKCINSLEKCGLGLNDRIDIVAIARVLSISIRQIMFSTVVPCAG